MSEQRTGLLQRPLGYWSVVLLGVNAVIGAGIFLTPGAVISDAGTLAPLAYVIAAVFALVLALVFATAARYVRTNGAAYAYTMVGIGRRTGIYVGVTHAFTAAIAWGTLASFAVTTFLQVVFPHEGWSKETGFLSVKTLTFVLFILLLLVINYFGNRVIAWTNGISTIGKVLALVIFIVAAVVTVVVTGHNDYHLAGGSKVYGGPSTYSLFGFIDVGTGEFASVVLAVIAALYAFTGFESIANAAEEMEQPDRTLPRAVPTAMVIVAVVYLLAITSGMLLAPDKIANSSDTVKLAAAITNDTVHTLVVIGALVSLFGINIASSFSAPRLFTALADDGLLPAAIARKRGFGVPLLAFGVTAVLAIAFPLSLGYDTANLTGLAVISRFVQFLVVPVVVIRFASSRKERWASIRTGRLLGTVVPAVAIVFSLFLLVSFDFKGIFVSGGRPNVLAITLLAIAFVIAPLASYLVDARRTATPTRA